MLLEHCFLLLQHLHLLLELLDVHLQVRYVFHFLAHFLVLALQVVEVFLLLLNSRALVCDDGLRGQVFLFEQSAFLRHLLGVDEFDFKVVNLLAQLLVLHLLHCYLLAQLAVLADQFRLAFAELLLGLGQLRLQRRQLRVESLYLAVVVGLRVLVSLHLVIQLFYLFGQI